MKLCLFILLISFSPSSLLAQSDRKPQPTLVVGGMILTADSLQPLSGATISIKGQSRSTISNDAGLFRILAYPGEIIQFRFVGYKMQEVLVPDSAEYNTVSLIRKMMPDVQTLPAAIVRNRPSKAQFERDFVNTKVNEDDLNIARTNMDPAILKELMKTLRHDASESGNMQLGNHAKALASYGQVPAMKIGDVGSWLKFFKAVKRGAFKKTSN